MDPEANGTPGTSRIFNYFWHFVNQARSAADFENSTFTAAIGERRSGKSIFSLCMAHAIDSGFDESQIAFGVEELKQLLTHKQNKAIIFEEAGAGAFNRDFMLESNKLLVKTLQIFGYKRLQIIANLQHINFLDSALRLQLNTIFRLSATHTYQNEKPITKSYAEAFLIHTDWISDPVMTHFKVEKNEVYKPLGKIPLPQIHEFFELTGVSDTLYKNYQIRKNDYFKEVTTEKTPEGPILSKKEINLLQRQSAACKTLVVNLVKEEKLSQRHIANLAGVPKSTLSDWISETLSPNPLNEAVNEIEK
mgnify:CR=1 FL=1